MSDVIEVVDGNFFKDPLPRADVVTMGDILHDWNLAQKLHLIGEAYVALPDVGELIASENVIDDSRRAGPSGS